MISVSRFFWASPFKMCTAWPSLCYDFPSGKCWLLTVFLFAVPTVTLCGSTPPPQRYGGAPRQAGDAKQLPPHARLILHSAQQRKEPEALADLCLLLVSKCHFSRQNKVSPVLPFTQPVCGEGFRVQGQGQGLRLNISGHCSPIPASCWPPSRASLGPC